MADPIKLQVLRALTEHLEAINPDNLYDIDLRGKVFRGRAVYGDDDPKTMISILEAPRPDFGSYAGENDMMRADEMLLLVQGWTEEDRENPTDNLYVLMDMVEKQLARIVEVRSNRMGEPMYPEAYMLGDLITSFHASPGVVRPADGPAQSASRAFFYLQLRVGLAG